MQMTAFIRWGLPTLLYLIIYGFHLAGIPSTLYDEALYGDTAKQFLNTFQLNNQLGGFSGQQLPLFPLILSLFYKVGSLSLFWGRLSSFLFGLVSLLGFIKLTEYITKDRLLRMILPLGFLILNTNIIIFRMIRPDSLHVMLFIITLLATAMLAKTKWQHWAIIGFLLSLLSFNHLIGFIAGLSIGGLAVIQSIKEKKGWPVLALLGGGLPILLVFLINILLQFDGLSGFIQYLDESKKFSGTTEPLLFTNIRLMFLEGYMMGIKRAYIVVMELVMIGLAFRMKHPLAKLIAWTSVLFLAIGLSSINLFLRPYFAIIPIMTLCLFAIAIEEKLFRKHILIGLLMVYLGNHAAGTAWYAKRNIHNERITPLHHLSLEQSYPILGPPELWHLVPQHPLWFIKEVPSHEALLDAFGGYYMVISPYKVGKTSSTTGQKALFNHDMHTYRFVEFTQRKDMGTLRYKEHIHPYGTIELWELSQ